MAISMYDFSIPVLARGLTNMSAILDKAAAHAAAKKFDTGVLAQSRLFPDMYPLVRQVQIACDTAKGAAGRLAGIEDDELVAEAVHLAKGNGGHLKQVS